MSLYLLASDLLFALLTAATLAVTDLEYVSETLVIPQWSHTSLPANAMLSNGKWTVGG